MIAVLLLLLFAQSSLGVVEGVVTDCTNGPEQAAYGATVMAQGDMAQGDELQVKTDLNGKFVLPLSPGTYTVVVTDYNGTANRQYVPVDSGQTIDIGTVDIGGGITGCLDLLQPD